MNNLETAVTGTFPFKMRYRKVPRHGFGEGTLPDRCTELGGKNL